MYCSTVPASRSLAWSSTVIRRRPSRFATCTSLLPSSSAVETVGASSAGTTLRKRNGNGAVFASTMSSMGLDSSPHSGRPASSASLCWARTQSSTTPSCHSLAPACAVSFSSDAFSPLNASKFRSCPCCVSRASARLMMVISCATPSTSSCKSLSSGSDEPSEPQSEPQSSAGTLELGTFDTFSFSFSFSA
eukprot:COSAG06_NODE_343_length_17092_cov_17.908021_1_plen_191_part_00